MRITFVVAEYNPLHNGHQKLIAHAKENTACDKLVCIMSGDVMQRGEIPIIDKYTRASWAIEAGADMVIELPVMYSLGSAQLFATGAKRIIDTFDCEKYLAFGSECGSTFVLETLAEMMISEEYQDMLKVAISDKNSYAKASHVALENYLKSKNIDTSFANILKEPNNTLAIEYIKALMTSAITYYTLKREGDFNDCLDVNNPSAASIRALLKAKKDVSSYVPDFVKKDLVNVKDFDDKLFSIIKYELPKKTNLDKILGMVEGIENRFLKCLKEASSLDEYFNLVKNKRFTRTSLQRAIISALLDNTLTVDKIMHSSLEYINILAIKDSAKNIFNKIDMDIVTKPSELDKLINEYHFDDSLSKKASSLFKSLNYEYDSYMRIIK